MRSNDLAVRISQQILDLIRDGALPQGKRLTERGLAERLKVSRTPIRSALLLVESAGGAIREETGGYRVSEQSPGGQPIPTGTDRHEQAYIKIAEDRLRGDLPNRVTTNELQRRYALTRSQLDTVLRRMTSEGWIERLQGHGWEFLPVLTSIESYRDSYRFRAIIEPAALLEPEWQMNRPALEKCRNEQAWLVGGAIDRVSSTHVFEMNSGMHERIIECSQNSFLIDSLRRVDRLRRLMDYRQTLNPVAARLRCIEHLEILDLILGGDNAGASHKMRDHLTDLTATKTMAKMEEQ